MHSLDQEIPIKLHEIQKYGYLQKPLYMNIVKWLQ